MREYFAFGVLYGPDSLKEMTLEIFEKTECFRGDLKTEIKFHTDYDTESDFRELVHQKFIEYFEANVSVLFFVIINEEDCQKIEMQDFGFESVFLLYDLKDLMFIKTPNSSAVLESIEFIMSKYSREE